jgi:sialate O-acetylesterase
MNLRSLLLLALVPCAALPAQVTLPKILSSHMVIQRNLPVHVWGMAAPGEEVAVTFRGQTRSAQAGQLGHWSVYLSPGAAGGPFQMTITGTPQPAAPGER